MRKYYLLLFAFVGFINPSIGQTWKESGVIGLDSNIYYINSDYVSKINDRNRKNIIKVWVKTTYKNFNAGNGVTYTEGEEKIL